MGARAEETPRAGRAEWAGAASGARSVREARACTRVLRVGIFAEAEKDLRGKRAWTFSNGSLSGTLALRLRS
jgi:hypothetical protein